MPKFTPPEVNKKSENVKEEIVDLKQKDFSAQYLPTFNVMSDALPSRGLSYPNGSNISYRVYSFGEIKKFNSSRYSLYEKYEFVMGGIDTSFPKGHLTLYDFLYIAMLRRINTLGGLTIPVEYFCSKCRQFQTFDWDSNTVEFDDLQAPAFPITITFLDGEKYKFYPITYEGFFRLEKKGLESSPIAILVEASGIKANSAQFQERFDKFYNCNRDDGALLDEIDKLLYHGIKPLVHTCSECGMINRVEVDRGDFLTGPFPEQTGTIKDRIQFGV